MSERDATFFVQERMKMDELLLRFSSVVEGRKEKTAYEKRLFLFPIE